MAEPIAIPESPEECRERWVNRRRMAWGAWWCAVIETAVLLFRETESLKELGTVIVTTYSLWAAIIGAYIGFSTWDDVKAGKGVTYVERADSAVGMDAEGDVGGAGSRAGGGRYVVVRPSR